MEATEENCVNKGSQHKEGLGGGVGVDTKGHKGSTGRRGITIVKRVKNTEQRDLKILTVFPSTLPPKLIRS